MVLDTHGQGNDHVAQTRQEHQARRPYPSQWAQPWRCCGVRSGDISGSCSDDLSCCGRAPAHGRVRVPWPDRLAHTHCCTQGRGRYRLHEGAGTSARAGPSLGQHQEGHKACERRKAANALATGEVRGRHPAPGCRDNWTALRTMLEQNKHILVLPARDQGDSASCWVIRAAKGS